MGKMSFLCMHACARSHMRAVVEFEKYHHYYQYTLFEIAMFAGVRWMSRRRMARNRMKQKRSTRACCALAHFTFIFVFSQLVFTQVLLFFQVHFYLYVYEESLSVETWFGLRYRGKKNHFQFSVEFFWVLFLFEVVRNSIDRRR